MSKIANADKSANQKNVNAHKTLFFRKLSIKFIDLCFFQGWDRKKWPLLGGNSEVHWF